MSIFAVFIQFGESQVVFKVVVLTGLTFRKPSVPGCYYDVLRTNRPYGFGPPKVWQSPVLPLVAAGGSSPLCLWKCLKPENVIHHKSVLQYLLNVDCPIAWRNTDALICIKLSRVQHVTCPSPFNALQSPNRTRAPARTQASHNPLLRRACVRLQY